MLLAGCANVPAIDRQLLQTEREPVRVSGSRGALSHAQSLKILEDLRRRSPDSGVLERHIAVEEALTDTPLSVGNKATPLEDGGPTYEAMLAAIKGAKQHVHLEMYIFEADEMGHLFSEALKDRARAGVRVRLLYDSVGCINTPKAFFDELRAAGVQVAEFNPVKSIGALDLLALQNRDHRKLLVTDGRVAFLGGINISSVYSGGSSNPSGSGGRMSDKPFEERPWRDLQVRLEGPVVADLQRAFARQWEKWAKQPLEDSNLYPPPGPAVGKEMVRALPGSPAENNGLDPLYVALISAIESADTEIMITNAYFVPHPQLLAALKAAAARKVSVTLLLPGKSDNALVYHAGRSYYGELLEAGVKIHERKTRFLHAKSAVVDGVWSAVGSTNLDWRSLAYNDELNAVIVGPEFAARMKAIFRKDIGNSEAITLERWRSRSLEDRVKEASARLLALWL